MSNCKHRHVVWDVDQRAKCRKCGKQRVLTFTNQHLTTINYKTNYRGEKYFDSNLNNFGEVIVIIDEQ